MNSFINNGRRWKIKIENKITKQKEKKSGMKM